MKILYFGTVCDPEHYESVLKNCKSRPSVATVVFETALLEGFKKNDVDLDVHSFPMIPAFPDCRKIYFGGTVEKLSGGFYCRWLKTVNVPFLKQFSRWADGRRIIKRWCKENAGTGTIITYSIPPFLARSIVSSGEKYRVKTIAIVPDLPKNMYQNHKGNALIDRLKQLYLNKAIRYQDRFNGYVYLTEAMSEIIAPRKPYMVMEGIYNDCEECDDVIKKSPKRAVMYAGRLHEKYGIFALMDAFEKINIPNSELWIFGDGSSSEGVKKRAEQNSKIRYFGRMPREEILKKEKEATLLVNPRGTQDDYTRYSFPSKTIEYMSSGTPLLTTRLDGIPKEYYNYVFNIGDNDVEEIKDALINILSMSDEELISKGQEAQYFIQKNKNSKKQVSNIIDFLKKINGENYENSSKEKI